MLDDVVVHLDPGVNVIFAMLSGDADDELLDHAAAENVVAKFRNELLVFATFIDQLKQAGELNVPGWCQPVDDGATIVAVILCMPVLFLEPVGFKAFGGRPFHRIEDYFNLYLFFVYYNVQASGNHTKPPLFILCLMVSYIFIILFILISVNYYVMIGRSRKIVSWST